MSELRNSRIPGTTAALKGFAFENVSKKMNTSQNKIPIVEFGEVKFEPAVLLF